MAEILEDFLVATPSGYYCRYGNFFLDPLMPVEYAVISHAHGDHARPGHLHIFATPGTSAFMQHRFPRQPMGSYQRKDYHEPFEINGVEIQFIPAGHMLGSAQIWMRYHNCTYLYTGDIKLQEDATCEPIELVPADVLITETTFANPEIQHPDPVAEIKKLNSTPHNIMLGCYALGKSQRITNLINEHCPEKTVYVHHNMLPLHRIYDRIGSCPLHYQIYQRKVLNDGKNKIYLVPPMTFNNYIRAKNVLRAFASGWQRLHRHNDLELYISDHIDWADLLAIIEKVKPQEIWTVHGDGNHLARFLNGKTIVKNINSNPHSNN